jgi:hypothetical protein
MPQLILLAAAGVAAFVGYRAFVREADRVTAKAKRMRREAETGSRGTLVLDPKTGEYRPAQD